MELPFFVKSIEEDGDVRAIDLKEKPRKLFFLWLEWRGQSKRAPKKSSIDPVGIARAGIMPDVWLIERLENGRFRFSLTGENSINAFERGLRGKTVEETYDAPRADLANYRYSRIINDECIEFSRGPVIRNGKLCYYAHRILLPLLNDAGESAFAIGVADQENYDRNAMGEPEFFYDSIVMTPVAKL
ncbi:MAG: PAS domain-containing protein [Rhodospirillaceae bacterium]|nr:PAS domain-containing protein [Rhodospirillaceae bacterium]